MERDAKYTRGQDGDGGSEGIYSSDSDESSFDFSGRDWDEADYGRRVERPTRRGNRDEVEGEGRMDWDTDEGEQGVRSGLERPESVREAVRRVKREEKRRIEGVREERKIAKEAYKMERRRLHFRKKYAGKIRRMKIREAKWTAEMERMRFYKERAQRVIRSYEENYKEAENAGAWATARRRGGRNRQRTRGASLERTERASSGARRIAVRTGLLAATMVALLYGGGALARQGQKEQARRQQERIEREMESGGTEEKVGNAEDENVQLERLDPSSEYRMGETNSTAIPDAFEDYVSSDSGEAGQLW